jgi:hypothetical protein
MIANRLNQLDSPTSPEIVQNALPFIFAQHMYPVFDASKSVEHEVAAPSTLKVLGYLSDKPNELELELEFVEKLRVTISKARALLYQVALWLNSSVQNEADEFWAIFINPGIAVDGDVYSLSALRVGMRMPWLGTPVMTTARTSAGYMVTVDILALAVRSKLRISTGGEYA